MRSKAEVTDLLAQLDTQNADALEDQDLDFKAWDPKSMDGSARTAIAAAVCMANGGGGTVVFGVDDKAVGRTQAILGVPVEVDVNLLRKAVYDSTDPKLTPVFDEIRVPEGSGRILVMQIHPGIPPYTDTKGRGTVRVGKDCQPLTGSLRRRVMVETGESDLTAIEVPGQAEAWISAAAMERLREIARRERAPDDMMRLSNRDLLAAIGMIRNGRLLRAGLLLAGSATALQEIFPGYAWTYLRMATDTDYTDRGDGQDAIPVALGHLLDHVMVDNRIDTVRQGLFHYEFRTYPEVALREALLNALVHADYRIHGPILVKQFQDRLEISNPGGFVGGITPNNILRHEPVSRSPTLVNALTRLRLVNRSNLGVRRMYQSLLIEGKEPPVILDEGEAVRVIFRASALSAPFRLFVAQEGDRGHVLSVEELLVIQHLLRHAEIDTAVAARITQQTEVPARETLSRMEATLDYLERGGVGRGTYWTLCHDIRRRLAVPGQPERGGRIDWEAAKTRVLSVLKHRTERREPGLSNAEVRGLTHYDRHQVKRLMSELQKEGHAHVVGRGRGARWRWSG